MSALFYGGRWKRVYLDRSGQIGPVVKFEAFTGGRICVPAISPDDEQGCFSPGNKISRDDFQYLVIFRVPVFCVTVEIDIPQNSVSRIIKDEHLEVVPPVAVIPEKCSFPTEITGEKEVLRLE
jgi:hypothetical protein